MKVGDLVRYRSRKSDDPRPPCDTALCAWGKCGIVIKVCKASFGSAYLENAVEFLDSDGDIHLTAQKNLEVISE